MSYDPYHLHRSQGAQPRGYDQWMALYNKGIVLGSKIVATFFYAPASSTSNAMSVGIVRKMAIADADAPTQTEGRISTRKILTASQDQKTCSMKYSYKELCKNPLDAEELQFSSTGNTTKQVYYHIGGFALNSTTQTCHFAGYVEYSVLLFEPINPAQS